MFRLPVSLRLVLVPVLASGALLLGGCESPDCCTPPEPLLKQDLAANFADAVVVPTYQRLATRLAELDAAARALRAEPTEARLTAARQAWFAARAPWEQGEAFQFGPVDSLGYEPALDSWPVSRTDVDAVLASDDALTAEYVGTLRETQKGFHTVEYLLFGEDAATTAEALTPRRLEYLTALTAELKSLGAALTGTWTQAAEGQPPYRDTLAGAGQSGNTAYPSVQSAAREMVSGIVRVLGEVADEKLAAPYDAKDPDLVESRFADNTVSDCANNLRGVESVYLGHLQDARAQGQTLRDVIGVGTDRDARIRGELAQALTALGRIPEPFRDAILAPGSADEIEAARDAVRNLKTTFERDVLPMFPR